MRYYENYFEIATPSSTASNDDNNICNLDYIDSDANLKTRTIKDIYIRTHNDNG